MQKIQQAGNKYILLELLGSGGMAEVYKAKLVGQRGFEKQIVIKKLIAEMAKTPEVVDSFIAEARLAALLQHENIAQIYDFGELEGSYFIAMEYLFGKDLASVLNQGQQQSAFSLSQALEIAVKICEGMEYAHNLCDLKQRPLHIIHRDLTPQNIFLTFDGKVKIIDFGVARAELYDTRTKMGMVKGKISYMSPEQLSEGKLDHRSDIFSIGILLYEMISQKRMYHGDTAQLIKKALAADFVPLEQAAPGLPQGVYAVVAKALAQKKENRYQSCKEMSQALGQCLLESHLRQQTKPLGPYLKYLFEAEYRQEQHQLPEQDFFPDELKTQVLNTPQQGIFSRLKPALKMVPVAVKTPSSSNGLISQYPKATATMVAGVLALVIFLALPPSTRKTPILPENNHFASEKRREDEKITTAPMPQEMGQLSSTGRDPVIATLHSKADRAIKEMRLSVPEKESAYSYYQEILAMDPLNPKAKEGLRGLGEKYADLAFSALAKKDYAKASHFIAQGLVIDPSNGRLATIDLQLTRQKSQVIADLETKGLAALAKDYLTSPKDSNAFSYFKKIAEIDPKNSRAAEGFLKIADRYFVLADKAFMDFNLKKARLYVSKGLAVVPNHPKLLELERDLAKDKIGIFFKTLEKSIKPIFQK